MKRPLATEGATLIYTSLLVMMLVAMTLVITSQIALRSRSSSQEQDQLLVAQYAAEAGIARGQSQLAQVQKALEAIFLPQTTSETTLRGYLASFCGVSASSMPALAKTTLAQPLTLCSATLGSTAATTLSGLVPAASMPAGLTATTWTQLFSAAGHTLPAGTVNGASVSVNSRIAVVDVVQTGVTELQLRMRIAGVRSTGQKSAARRVLNASSDGLFVVTFSRPSFAAYAQFRNQTTSATTGDNLYFSDGEEFRGPVHTNGTLRLSGNPRFYGDLSTAGTATDYHNLPCARALLDAGSCPNMFPEGGKPTYSTGVIALPTNNNNQMRAALGLPDTGNTTALTATQLASTLGVSSVTTGVYMSQPGTPSTLFGGMYVSGPAAIKLSTTGTPTRQIIEITQIIDGETKLTRMQEGASGNWTRRTFSAGVMTSNTPMSGSFNGVIYVNGPVDLYGDGTAAPDIGENSALNISLSNGDMKLKNSVTYTQDPLVDSTAVNVLGLFNSTGSILLDGPSNQDMNVNATILASASTKGFGTVNAGTSRGSPKPNVNLIGGVIEDQSQTVSSGSGGYNRKYKYDPRFSDGYSPPYFPMQQIWVSNSDLSFDIGVLKQGK